MTAQKAVEFIFADDNRLRNIFDKVGVSNRLELALFAINHQLL
jgi:hypothetical protein